MNNRYEQSVVIKNKFYNLPHIRNKDLFDSRVNSESIREKDCKNYQEYSKQQG